MLTEKSLGCRTNAKPVLELFVSAVSYPRNFRRKAFNVVFFFLQKALGDKHRHADILVTQCLETSVKVFLNVLPDSVAIRSDDHTALYAGVLDKLCFLADVGVPFCKVFVH